MLNSICRQLLLCVQVLSRSVACVVLIPCRIVRSWVRTIVTCVILVCAQAPRLTVAPIELASLIRSRTLPSWATELRTAPTSMVVQFTVVLDRPEVLVTITLCGLSALIVLVPLLTCVVQWPQQFATPMIQPRALPQGGTLPHPRIVFGLVPQVVSVSGTELNTFRFPSRQWVLLLSRPCGLRWSLLLGTLSLVKAFGTTRARLNVFIRSCVLTEKPDLRPMSVRS